MASISLTDSLMGKGIGREIYNTAEEFSRGIGCDELVVYASKAAKSVTFWSHMGMTPKRESPGMVIMHKEL